MAIIVNFKREKVEYKRVINSNPRSLNSSSLDPGRLEKIRDRLGRSRYLGIDWGEKRIGLAVGDSETGIAIPFKVVSSIDDIIKILKEEYIDVIVVGKPLKMLSVGLRLSNNFLDFLELLKKRVEIPIITIDERLSSKAADALVGNKKTKAPQDAVAAMLILQSYLDRKVLH